MRYCHEAPDIGLPTKELWLEGSNLRKEVKRKLSFKLLNENEYAERMDK